MAEDNLGWIESVDPTTGRTFYANKYTRTTQWDPPPGWKSATRSSSSRSSSSRAKTTNGHGAGRNNGTTENYMSDIERARRKMEEYQNGGGRSSSRRLQQEQQKQHQHRPTHDSDDVLPDGWEEMTDPTTGRKFYIDHANKVTTWERPRRAAGNSQNGHGSSSSNGHRGGATTSSDDDGGFGFGFGDIMQLNQHGSHARWDDDPRSGNRASNGGSRGGRSSHSKHSGGYHRGNSHGSHHSYTNMSHLLNTRGDSHPGPPPLDFVVVSVPDALRMECPGCNAAFTYTKRRHHCRLCGDVFCDACSTSRTVLPLDGPEFDTPVRVCDVCMKDVKKGNYFSMRRYLTPLQLFDPNNINHKSVTDGAGSGDATKEITSKTVAASLSSLSTDIDAMVNDPTSFREKITIPASTLVTAVGKHLKLRDTAEYAIRVLASLLMLGNVAGDDSFALAIYEGDADDADAMKNSDSTNSVPSLSEAISEKQGKRNQQSREIIEDILAILEWNGTDDRSLGALEQAIKVIYYITEPTLVASVISKREVQNGKDGDDDGPVDVDAVGESMHDFVQVDIHRAFRSMLDHATSSASISLQRWATATLRHLITEDQRRACVYSSGPGRYESFMTHLVSTGGIMILCSLLSSDDSETRTHATSTLEAIVIATREIGMALGYSNIDKFKSRVGRGTADDASIVSSIVSNGGCGAALAHLLISSDESVAEMGCSFATSLISPLLTDPRGSGKGLKHCVAAGAGGEVTNDNNDGLSAYRQAALSLVVGEGSGEVSCLPSLIQIIRSGVEENAWGGHATSPRSMKLRVAAGECLAAISLAIGHILGAGVSSDSLYARARQALQIMEQEQIYEVAYKLVTSDSARSFDPSRNTPQARLREASGLTLLAVSSCSDVAASYLASNKAISNLLTIAAESLDAPSALRGEWASRGLCYLECSAMLLLRAWRSNNGNVGDGDGDSTMCVLDALDANAIGLASNFLTRRVYIKQHDKAYSQMRIKIATCYMLAAMFGIALRGEREEKDNVRANSFGGRGGGAAASRLYSAIDADCAAALASGAGSDGSRTDLVANSVSLLSATLPYAHRFANEEADEPLPMMDLSEACLLAVGSMCGAAESEEILSNLNGSQISKYSHTQSDASQLACRALTTPVKDNRTPNAIAAPLLPSVLVGALGESLVHPALRLTLAIAQNGSSHDDNVLGELARSGMLVPVGDILQHSLSSGERDMFSMAIAIVRFCGPSCTAANYADRSSSGSIASLQNSIRTLSYVLMIIENGGDTMNLHRRKTLLALKYESLLALEALSSNEAMHSALVDAFPSLTEFLMQLDNVSSGMDDSSTTTNGVCKDDMVCAALKTIRSIISFPSSSSSPSVALNGMISSLVKILNRSYDENETDSSIDNRKQEVSLELLHTIALGGTNNMEHNVGSSLLSSGVLDAVMSFLGGETGTKLSDKMTSLGLDIVDFVISDINPTNPATVRQFIDSVASHEPFLRALIATMIAAKGGSPDKETPAYSLYGKPLFRPNTADYDLYHTATSALCNISSLLCIDVSGSGKEHFLHAFMLKDLRGAVSEAVSLASCIFLEMLMDEVNGVCVPQSNPADQSFFFDVKLPIMRSCLMEVLALSLEECMTSGNNISRKLICDFKIPQMCLSFCQSNKVFQAAFELYETAVPPLPIDVIGDLLLSDKSSLVALFDLVTAGKNHSVQDFEHKKQTFAHTLGSLAKAGFLSAAVERFGVRNNAIAALSAAMQGSDDGIIDDNEDSLPRICVESLAAILCKKNQKDELDITALEARAMATAIGKILSSTVLNRFFTQASLETTFHHFMDHSSDRSAISGSPEARLLCSMASFPETLEMLRKIGGLEAISLIAHEGELTAILAIQKASEISPSSVVDVDAHQSIMDALVQVECKVSTTDFSDDNRKLREVAATCIQIITVLTQNAETKGAVRAAEQSFGCLAAATSIISASSKSLNQKSKSVGKGATSADKRHVPSTEKAIDSVDKDAPQYGSSREDLQIGDLVLVDSTSTSAQASPSTSSHSNVVEGIVAHLGPVKFAPGDDWIGVQLTASSIGLGRNDGSVKGVRYFDCGDNDKNGVFARRNNVKKKEHEEEPKSQEVAEIPVETKENNMPDVETQHEETWGRLLLKDDFSLERVSFALLLSLSSSEPHRDMLMNKGTVLDDMIGVIQLHSPALADFQCSALDLLVSLTLHLHEPEPKLIDLFCSVVNSLTKVLQVSKDKRLLYSTKQQLSLALSGIENIFSLMDADERVRTLNVSSDLFIFLADSLYKGPKSRRLAATSKDGMLFYRLSSFFVLSLGSESFKACILSVRFVSSLIRFIMMTAGLSSLECQIPIKNFEGGEWDAALLNSLTLFKCNMIQASQNHLGVTYASLIADTESSPKSFSSCLAHIVDMNGAASMSAKQIMANLERFA